LNRFQDLSASDHADELTQLPENTLARNLGLDLIVVVTKVGTIKLGRLCEIKKKF
jgi:hypothetical protein